MIDRLLSGAGSLAHLGDRIVRLVTWGSLAGSLSRRYPGSLVLAVALLVASALLVAAGIEAVANPVPVEIAPASIAADDLGSRVYATVSGRLLFASVETYTDTNDNGHQEPDETGESWNYFLVDESTSEGVVVRTTRPPAEIFRFAHTGRLVAERDYIAADVELMAPKIEELGLTINEELLLDTTASVVASPIALDLSALPGPGRAASLEATTAGYTRSCSQDLDGDGVCGDDELDLFDLLAYDAASRQAMVVVVRDDPTSQPATFSGMLRADPEDIASTRTAEGLDFASLGVTVSDTYVLVEGAKPTSAPGAFILAVVVAAIAVVMLFGVRTGYLVYRRSRRGELERLRPEAIGPTRITHHVTGTLDSPRGRIHVREATASLEGRSEVASEADGGDPEGDDDAASGWSDRARAELIVRGLDGEHGVALSRGGIRRLSVGTAFPLSGPRPALRVDGPTGRLILSFRAESDRDRAAAALLDASGLHAVGDGTAG